MEYDPEKALTEAIFRGKSSYNDPFTKKTIDPNNANNNVAGTPDEVVGETANVINLENYRDRN